MPLRPARRILRACRRHPTALILTIAISIVAGLPAIAHGGASVAPASTFAAPRYEPAAGSPGPRSEPAIAMLTEYTAGEVANVQATLDPAGASILVAAATSTLTGALIDTASPSAALEPLSVDQGELILRWRDTDGMGSGIAGRTVRIEQAVATPTGCGEFAVVGGISLGAGEYDRGTLSLGQPPSNGCRRVSLELTDRVGRTSIIAGQPYRIAPPVVVAKSKPAPPRWSGKFNLYRATAFVTQKTFKWCVAASVQMMVNIVRKRTDRSRATQARMIAYAQRWDNGPYGEEGGTDVTGWMAALRHYGAGKYRAVGSTTAAGALRVAATAMRQTGRPAGILVMEGRHAWVLHGFESKTDPRKNRKARIDAVRISGPLYPLQQENGYDPRPNTRLSVKKLSRSFKPTSVGAFVGKYVVVIPTH